MKRNILTLIMVRIVGFGYIGSGKILDKKFAESYDITSIVGKDRYETSVLLGELEENKNAKSAFLINTDNIGEAITAVSFANIKNIPVLFTKGEEISVDIWGKIKNDGIENVYIVGGINSVSKPVERAVERTGAEAIRITDVRGFDISLRLADKLYKMKPFDEIAICSGEENGLSEGVSMSIAASREGIPVIPINDSNVYDIVNFIKERNINKTYLVGDESKVPETIAKLIPNTERISGETVYRTNRKIIERFYDMDNVEEAFVAKGGTFLYGTNLQIGEFVNSISVANISADKNIPIIFGEENYLEEDQREFIDKHGIKKLTAIGFTLEREEILNVERTRTASAVVLMLISILLFIIVVKKEHNKEV